MTLTHKYDIKMFSQLFLWTKKWIGRKEKIWRSVRQEHKKYAVDYNQLIELLRLMYARWSKKGIEKLWNGESGT